MKSVAIVGAGPAGLVAAKTLLHSYPLGKFQVSVFEQTNNVGGLWAVEANPDHGLINPDMSTNLSQFTVCFSDQAWDTLELEPAPNAYPKAWQVNRYLECYAQKFLPDTIIHFRTKVKFAERIQLGWRTTLTNLETREESVEIYDYLLVASGLFSEPAPTQFTFDDIAPEKSPVPILHSSKFRRLGDLSLTGQQSSGGKILVVGGSHSGAEVAAGIALQMSDVRYPADGPGIQPLDVIHVAPHPISAIPPFVQPGNGSPPTFLPLDTLLNDLASRKDDPISFTFGHLTPEKTKQRQIMLDKLVNGAKDEGKDSDERKEDVNSPEGPYAVISDHYAGFVASGAITPLLGRVTSVEHQRDNAQKITGFVRAKVDQGSSNIEVQDIAAIVNATGFSASPALNFLSDEIKKRLGFDSSCPRLPLLLDSDASTSSIGSPNNLALIGFSYGSYWGILEAQARMIAHKWSLDDPQISQQDKPLEDEKSKKIHGFMTELRTMMKNNPSTVAQNFFGDYPGLMEECFRYLDLQRVDMQYGPRAGMVSPARYVDNGCDRAEAEQIMSKIYRMQDASANSGAFAARAAFIGLHGSWKAKSKGNLDPAYDLLPLTASFHPRRTTAVGFDAEYLFILHNTTKPKQSVQSSTIKDEVEKRVYRLREIDNEIEIWTADYPTEKMLLRLEFGKATAHQKSLAVTNTAMDESTTYDFTFSGIQVPTFKISVSSNTGSIEGGSELEFSR